MRQYRQIKQKNPGTILLFRLGDFYETFGDDAELTAKACGITLTKRNNGAAGEIPLAGFPHHQLDSYLPRLVKAGHRVAVCEQLEDPKQAKGIVRRGVVEVVTPGVVMYDKLLDHKSNTYAASVVPPRSDDEPWGVAVIDVSTGTFIAGDVAANRVQGVLESYQPAEVLVDKSRQAASEALIQTLPGPPAMSRLEDWHYDLEFARTTLTRHFETASLKGFGIEDSVQATTAAGVLLHYVSETQQGALRQITSLRKLNTEEIMILDSSTRRNLEIHASMQAGERNGALVGILDRTTTPMGGRLLRWWLQAPLVSAEGIDKRQTVVQALVDDADTLEDLRRESGRVGDLERLMTKIVAERATARDLAALRSGLSVLPGLRALLTATDHASLHAIAERIDEHQPIVDLLERALTDEPPVAIGTGNMFSTGYHAELDEVVEALVNGKTWIKEYQERERDRSGIANLKVGFNNVFGYYIEISKAQIANAPEDYDRKQTLTNSERFITPELKDLESKLLSAEERATALESRLLSELRQSIGEHCSAVQRTSSLVAALDCLATFADVAIAFEYVRPVVHDGTDLHIVDGRHPVIERVLPPGTTFVSNSIVLDTTEHQLQVITGPNMSGKSSYLRQVGLITFLAHVGSFVPAASARIPLTDRIFTRVGAQDNIVAGESTFLVEMQESANILNNATARSLVLLDEVGRGTATFDGISIAWAIAEFLHEVVGAKTLFATHYHELTALADHFARIENVQVEVREVEDDIVFTHRVIPGHTDHSFGIHVAKMAGLPPSVVSTARLVLDRLEQGQHDPAGGARSTTVDRLDLERAGQLTMFQVKDDELRQRVRELDVENMTPLEALQALADLKGTTDE